MLLIETIVDVAAEADLYVRVHEQTGGSVEDMSDSERDQSTLVTRKISIYLILFSIAQYVFFLTPHSHISDSLLLSVSFSS